VPKTDEDADALLRELRRLGCTVEVRDEKLVVRGPRAAITPAISERVVALKPELIRRLATRPIDKHPPGALARLGFIQERMWLHSQMNPDTVLYNLPVAWRLIGTIDVEAFQRAFNAILARHDILRAEFVLKDIHPQLRVREFSVYRLSLEDISTLPEAARENSLAGMLAKERDQLLDIEAGRTFSGKLIRMSAEQTVFCLITHHLVWDAWSYDVFLDELAAEYRDALASASPARAAPAIQYVDYALWHRDWLQSSGQVEESASYWLAKLRGAAQTLNLPTDFPRPRAFSHVGDWEPFQLSAALMGAVTRLGERHGATPFMVLLAAWYAFLYRLTNDRDLLVGVPVLARTRPEVLDLIGCFVNTICLRCKVEKGESFADLLERVRDISLSGFEHQDAPLELILDRLDLRLDRSRTPLFQAMFSHQQVGRRPPTIGPLRLEQAHINPTSTPTDVMLAIMEGKAGARAVFHYSTALFTKDSIRAFRDRYLALVSAVTVNEHLVLEALPALSAAERAIIEQSNATSRPLPDRRSPLGMFLKSAAAHPDKIAVITGEESISYSELRTLGQAIGMRLREAGVKPGDVVAHHLERSKEAVAAILAIWYAGGVYLPVDPALPASRVRWMLEHSGCSVALTASDAVRPIEDDKIRRVEVCASQRVPGPAVDDQAFEAAAESCAYIMYTSGSTGAPKAVEVSHGSLGNLLQAMHETPGIHPDDRLLAITTFSFDISLLEIFGPLTAGAQLVLARRDEAADPGTLASMIARHAVTILQGTPSLWQMLIAGGWHGKAGLKALCGGEALKPALVHDLLALVGEIWNMYGPTETTVWSTCARITSEDYITIGRPILNTQVHVLDQNGEVTAPGVAGEIYIGGAGVALGYRGDEAQTQSRFAPDGFSKVSSARLYRTGDWAKRAPNGDLHYLGRRDGQTKIRGHRVELGEIEHALERHDEISIAAVLVDGDDYVSRRLVAYVQPASRRSPTGSELRRYLRQHLPEYMIPNSVVEVSSMPLSSNGKVDRAHLSKIYLERAAEQREVVAPKSDLEAAICGVWKEVLKLDAVSVTDNFFELGGNSLQAAQMTVLVHQRTGYWVALRSVIFESVEQIGANATRAA
jgi:amino acid adenylation domain-containing protein